MFFPLVRGSAEVSARLQPSVFVGVLALVTRLVGDRERHRVARDGLQFAAVLVGVGILITSLTGVLLLVAAFFILVLALARRVQPGHPRHDEPVIVGILVDLRAVQVVRGQIVLVVVGLRAERQGVVPVRPALSADRGRGDGVRPRSQAEGFRAGSNASNCSKV